MTVDAEITVDPDAVIQDPDIDIVVELMGGEEPARTMMLDALNHGKHVVTVGDYNTAHQEIDIARPRDNENVSGFLPIERAWIDKYIKSGFVDSYRELNPSKANAYTWWSNLFSSREKNVGWRLDYSFVDKGLMASVLDSKILPEVEGSDHCPICIELDPPFAPIKIVPSI